MKIFFEFSDLDDLDPDLARLGSLGFTGCLSVVQFNSITPLKAALLQPETSPVQVLGPLVRSNCGSSVSANPYSAENTRHLSGNRMTVTWVTQQMITRLLIIRKITLRSAGHIQPTLHLHPVIILFFF